MEWKKFIVTEVEEYQKYLVKGLGHDMKNNSLTKDKVMNQNKLKPRKLVADHAKWKKACGDDDDDDDSESFYAVRINLSRIYEFILHIIVSNHAMVNP